MTDFDVILADPPWQYRKYKGAKATKRTSETYYPCLSIEQLCSLPVGKLAKPNAALFLWVTSPVLLDYPARLLKAWGFEYKTVAWMWLKTTKDRLKAKMGMGTYTRSCSEMCLLAMRGSLPVSDHGILGLITAPPRAHSQKPVEQYDIIEGLYPHCSFIELFAREKHSSRWSVWGDQVTSDIKLVEGEWTPS